MSSKNKNQSSENPAFIIQFLALNLLVLAFFILLVSMSSFEENKTKAVVDSMNSVFNPMAKVKIETVFSSKSGNIISPEEFQDHVEGVFSAAIGVVKTDIVEPGKVMRVVMPAARFFETNSDTIREENLPLVDRIISSVSARPPGYRFDMEFVIGRKTDGAGLSPISQTLQMARAGAFARSMLSRGIPRDSISIGIRDGDPQSITMWFYIRSSDGVGEYYRRLIGLAAPVMNDQR